MDKKEYIDGIDDFIQKLKYEEKAESTLIKYHTDLLKFADFLKDGKDITKDDVISFKKFLNEIYLPASINSFIVVLNKYFKYLKREDLCVKQLKLQRKRSLEDVLTVTDYKRLLRIAKKKEDMESYYIMKILGTTGIRIDELKWFTAESIKKNIIEVRNKGKIRNVYLRQDLARELRKYCRAEKIKEGQIFRLHRTTIWRRLKKYAGMAKVKSSKVHPHSFRHMFSKLYLAQTGNDYMGLADILGHNSLDTTRIYQVSSDQEKREKLERLKFYEKI